MFLLPIPESWNPAEHDWTPVDVSGPEGPQCFLRGTAATSSASVLTLMRNPETGQRLAWFGPAQDDKVVDPVPQGELHAMVGVAPGDWGIADRPPGERKAS